MNLIKKFISIGLAVAFLSTLTLGSLTLAADDDGGGSSLEQGAESGAGNSINTDPADYDFEAGEEGLSGFSVTDYLTLPPTTQDCDPEDENCEPQQNQEQRYLNDTEVSPIADFILTIIDFLAKVVGTFAVILIIVGGVLLVSSEGDDNKVQKGKGIIMQAIIGLIIALASYIIVTFVQSLLYVQS